MQLQVETQIYKKNAIKDGINDAGTKANHYITLLEDEFGIRVHGKYNPNDPDAQPYSSFIQINSDDISMWRAGQEKMRLDDSALRFFGYISDTQRLLAEYGNAGLVLYKPESNGTNKPVIIINSQGAYIDGSVQIGGYEQSEYLNSNIKLGGTNLLLDSTKDAAQSHTTYPIADFNFSESLIEGEQYIITAKITASAEKKSVGFYHSGGSYSMSGWLPISSDGYYETTFIATADMAAQTGGLGYGFCRVYVSNNTTQQGSTAVTGTAHVDWIKIEKGNKATSWSPAPEDLEKSYYGNCETAAATADKQVSCAGFSLKTGAIVGVKFTNGNTCTSNITLNINGTGAKTVYFLGQTTGTDSRLNVSLAANAIVSVIYDGTYWRILSIDQTSTMVTRIGDSGISIHPSGTTQHRVEINSSGMNVYQNNASIAEYGTSARIGSSTGSRFLMNAGSLQAYDNHSEMYFEVTAEHIKYGQNIGATTDDIPTKISALENDADYATQTEANEAAEDAVSTYILDTSGSNGIRVHNAGDLTNFVQINSTDISMWRSNKKMMALDNSALIFYDGGGTANTNKRAEFGSSIILYNPTKGTKAVEITSSGATFTGNVTATSLTIDGTNYASDVKTISSKASTGYVDTAKAAAEKTATNYIGISGSGIKVAASNPPASASNYVEINSGAVNIVADSTHKIIIDSNNMNIYAGDANNSVAQYGDTARIGNKNGAYIQISGSEMIGTTGEMEYFSIDTTGGTLNTKINIIARSIGTPQTVIALSEGSQWSSVASGDSFFVKVVYTFRNSERTSYRSSTIQLKFTKGTASTSNTYIKYDGSNTITITSSAPTISGYTCYGKRVDAHFFKSSITPFYRFGNNVAESGGAYSFLMGTGTKSNSANQLVVGQYNDDDSLAYFIVGNGSSDSSRSNAFSVNSNGWVYCDAIDVNGSAYIPTLYLGGHSTAVGSILSARPTATVSLSADTAQSLCSVTLPAGTWVLVGQVRFSNASDSSYRIISINTSYNYATNPDIEVSALDRYPTNLTATKIISVSSNTTYYLNVMAGKACSIAAGTVDTINYLKAVCIA